MVVRTLVAARPTASISSLETFNARLTPDRLFIEVAGHFQQIIQWSAQPNPSWARTVSASYQKAEALLQVLEVMDCGSVGGYSRGQTEAQKRTLFHRWDYLYRRYIGDPETRKYSCTSYHEMKSYFSKGE